MIELALKTIFSYLLGSLLGSLVLGWLTGRADIRALGSGNPGSTNALRSHGKLFALGVALVDVGKGWLATRIVPAVALPLSPAAGAVHSWVPAACGMAVMLGHVYPVWFGFRGGKGVATFFGAVLGLAPRLVLAPLAVWAGVLLTTGYVGLASMVAAASLPLCIAAIGLGWHRPFLGFALLATVLILITHRANIARMLEGSEPRARRPWQLSRRVES
ncbi:MAG TPA: glycerol-3-phosphate 1-O-acyltransferase PlsY [Steroidobacteraceae bacterium]|nr:glycerol-3-phosphate 1-O-acyltransferase PlsY [Steroidobacteraceae bacterium]